MPSCILEATSTTWYVTFDVSALRSKVDYLGPNTFPSWRVAFICTVTVPAGSETVHNLHVRYLERALNVCC